MKLTYSEKDSKLLAVFSPNGMPSDYVQLHRTSFPTRGLIEVRQVRRGEPGRSVYFTDRDVLVESLRGWTPGEKFGEESPMLAVIEQKQGNRIEVLATVCGTEARCELRQVRERGARSIYLTPDNVAQIKRGYAGLHRGPRPNLSPGLEKGVLRCWKCEQPVALKSETDRTSTVHCSISCRQQKPSRRANEHRDSLICQLIAEGVEKNRIADAFGLTPSGISAIIRAF